MSAEILRRAAALMRERAEQCPPQLNEEPWFVVRQDRHISHWDSFAAAYEAEAEFIASWHPAVALAAADLLNHEANRLEALDANGLFNTHKATSDRALALARAYLEVAS